MQGWHVLLRVFLDTNVLLDFVLGREPWRNDAACLLQESHRARKMKAYVASLSLKDVYFTASKMKSEPLARQAVRMLMECCEIVEVGARTCLIALDGPEPDFEDGLIAAAATECGADVIVSRDVTAFARLSVPKTSPSLFAAFFFSPSEYTQAIEEHHAVVAL